MFVKRIITLAPGGYATIVLELMCMFFYEVDYFIDKNIFFEVMTGFLLDV